MHLSHVVPSDASQGPHPCAAALCVSYFQVRDARDPPRLPLFGLLLATALDFGNFANHRGWCGEILTAPRAIFRCRCSDPKNRYTGVGLRGQFRGGSSIGSDRAHYSAGGALAPPGAPRSAGGVRRAAFCGQWGFFGRFRPIRSRPRIPARHRITAQLVLVQLYNL